MARAPLQGCRYRTGRELLPSLRSLQGQFFTRLAALVPSPRSREVLNRVIVSGLGPMHPLLLDVLVVCTMSVALSHVVPVVNKPLRGWLAR